LVDGYRALLNGHWKTARKLALWVNMVCGESVRDAQQLLDAVAVVAGQKTEKVVPPIKLHPLCEPLFDKPPPRRTPGRPAKG
jgi:hypothetical protein